MDIKELAAQGANVTIAVRPEDLEAFARILIVETKRQMAKEKDETILNPKEVQDMLGIAPSTLWMYEKRGILVPSRVGSKRFYRLSDVQALLKN